jgi:hypothetical protein
MSEQQTADMEAVLNPQPQQTEAEAQPDPVAAQQAIAANPLLSAAQEAGFDVAQFAQTEVNGSTAIPLLSGFKVVWSETFENGVGKLSRTWGPGVDTSVPGQITLRSTEDNQQSGTMVPPTAGELGPDGKDVGFSYGLFSFRLRMNGSGSPGPYALTWPCTDVWPGDELDVVERKDGKGYGAHHWAGAGNTNEFRTTWYEDVDLTQTNTFQMLWMPNEIRYFVNGRPMGEPIRENVPKDAKDGNQNQCPGVGMQTHWAAQNGVNEFTVYEVNYAVPEFGNSTTASR